MTRSRKKTPLQGNTTATTEKEDKKINHRRIRRAVTQAIGIAPEAELLPHEKELSNPWLMDKDGKHRFDPALYPKSMRK